MNSLWQFYCFSYSGHFCPTKVYINKTTSSKLPHRYYEEPSNYCWNINFFVILIWKSKALSHHEVTFLYQALKIKKVIQIFLSFFRNIFHTGRELISSFCLVFTLLILHSLKSLMYEVWWWNPSFLNTLKSHAEIVENYLMKLTTAEPIFIKEPVK